MPNFKKIINKIHLWLGLSSGLVVFIIAITGCLYAFQVETQEFTQDFRFVESQNNAFLPPSKLKEIALKELPKKHLHAMLYSEKNRAAQAIFYGDDHYDIIYLNPYSGKILKIKDMNWDFFRIVLMGHYYLWLPPKVGQPITASATLIFVVMLISGIILWYPKNKAAAKQRFKFQWKNTTQWKRKNYDLHTILGFYASFIALILAITGLVWGFQWFGKMFYESLGGEKSLIYQEPISVKLADKLSTQSPAIDRVWQKMILENPTAKTIEVHIPETDSSAIAANVNTAIGTTWKTDYRYFDQYSLKELSVNHLYGRFQKDATFADKTMRMNYDIHTGAILGIFGKFLAFFASLVVASLPITGFLIWWGRKKNAKQKTEKAIELVHR